MDAFQALLGLATLLCSLVAGLVFAFAAVAMPGIGQLEDRPFLQAFQAIDRVIQNKNATALTEARDAFETPWNRWNIFRTVVAIMTTVLIDLPVVAIVMDGCGVSGL